MSNKCLSKLTTNPKKYVKANCFIFGPVFNLTRVTKYSINKIKLKDLPIFMF